MLGFIGGSGIYESLSLENTYEEHVRTPYGDPSAPVTVGELDGTRIAFVPRHGRNHQYSPTNVPYRSNVYALKRLGVERVLASNAVGSLREGLPPRTIVVPDQVFDRTRHRPYTFFDEGIVVHMPFAEPYCPHVSAELADCARAAGRADRTDTSGGADTAGGAGAGGDGSDGGFDVHEGGTYVCIEGPQFSTRAESEHFRASGFDVIGMTTIPEAKLAREAELCYATIAGVTDYDVWKEDSQVTLQEVLENAAANEDAIKAIVERAVRELPEERECDCGRAIEGAINTPETAIPREIYERHELLVGDYVEG
jgi:5'-methylthioadenosine phosphorylase